VGDALDIPHPDSRFDFAISIAVIHHFSSQARRVASIRSILATLKPSSNNEPGGGKALIHVWALEQKGSRRGWDVGDPQDVFVPWVMSKRFSSSKGGTDKQDHQNLEGYRAYDNQGGMAHDEAKAGKDGKEGVTYQRYYHLYHKGELEADIVSAGGMVLESGYEKDNWWAICAPHK
jgi:tRNA (uracil-5-)-methyltransferase TRM9